MINETFELRKKYGKFEVLENSENLESRNHVANCQACGSSKPERLIAVQSENGKVLLVGSVCAGILISGKNPKIDENLKGTGEIYQDGEKEIIYITIDWLKNLGDYIYQEGIYHNRYGHEIVSNFETNYNAARYTINHSSFLASIYDQGRRNGKISVKQYNAVNKSMGIN